MTSGQISKCLKARHPSPEWVWAQEFALSPGYSLQSQRRIDGLAMNCYPSRGHMIVGYEIKVSRGDFLQELKDPSKRKQAVELCDRFYFAVPRGLVRPEEIPADCGLIECWVGDFHQGEQLAMLPQKKSKKPKDPPAFNSRLRLDRWPKGLPDQQAKKMATREHPRWFMAAVIRQFDPERQSKDLLALKSELQYARQFLKSSDKEGTRARRAWDSAWMKAQDAWKESFTP